MPCRLIGTASLFILASATASFAAGPSAKQAGDAIAEYKRIEIYSPKLGECIKKGATVYQCEVEFDYIVPRFRDVGMRSDGGTYTMDQVPGGYKVVSED